MTDKMQSYIESEIARIIEKHQGKAEGPCLEEIEKKMPTYGIETLKTIGIR